MKIDELTLGQIKEIAGVYATMQGKESQVTTPHIGKKCIVRTYASGVFFATVVSQVGRQVEMANARRLWAWKAAEGISLSAVAMNGVNPSGCKFPDLTPEHTVLDALEIIPASGRCIKSIESIPAARV